MALAIKMWPGLSLTRWGSAFKKLSLAILLMSSLSLPAADSIPLLLAETDHGQADVSLYLISEKLDGVRAFWDGQVLRTRKGNLINTPAWFVSGFPAHPLDGELWIGRGQFERLSGTVRRQIPEDAAWREVTYQVFELPQAPGSFRQRAKNLLILTAEAAVPWLQAVDQFELGSRKSLEKKLAEVIKAGGEGLMLHRADAQYTTGRSADLLKLKPWYDAEATVIGHQPGKGKFSGMLGALRVRTEGGIEFMLGTGLSTATRRNPPPIGTLVTYRYRELNSKGRPRFASFYRIRDI